MTTDDLKNIDKIAFNLYRDKIHDLCIRHISSSEKDEFRCNLVRSIRQHLDNIYSAINNNPVNIKTMSKWNDFSFLGMEKNRQRYGIYVRFLNLKQKANNSLFLPEEKEKLNKAFDIISEVLDVKNQKESIKKLKQFAYDNYQ